MNHRDGETPPRRIGPYNIHSRLGSGGMGEVYRAYDEGLERWVALKRIRLEKAEDPRLRERFLGEARAAAKLNHPNLVQVRHILEERGSVWIVMEYVEGTTLTHLIETEPIELRKALAVALEIARGLMAAHAEGIVHRDLKGDNIVVTANDQVKILDFGLAKELSRLKDDTSLSLEGHVLGTPHAMSPEQIKGPKVDHRSDLFSLGTLLYETLTGVSPFLGSDPVETMANVCHLDPPQVKERVPEIPAELSALVTRLLAKDRARRPQTAREVATALEQIVDSLGSPAPLPLPQATSLDSQTTIANPGPTLPATAELKTGGERRQVTVMCCDLMILAKTPGSLDPETLYEVIPEFQALARSTVAGFGGWIGSALGHRMVVYFGYPQAHEDDPRRAVHTALQLVARVGGPGSQFPHHQQRGRGLAIRIGIHTGPAVVMPGTSSQPQLTLGETLDHAGEMQGLAEPNDVVVSADTYRLIEGFFSCQALEDTHGSRRVLDPTGIHSRVEIGGRLTPVVGRERELAFLKGRWQLAREGRGQVVLLSGEAGIGKSRLVRTLEEHLRSEVSSWRICHGSPYTRSSPLNPIRDLLRQLLGSDSDESTAQQLERIEDAVGDCDLSPDDTVPLLAALLTVPTDGRFPTLRLSPERQREMTMDALLRLFLAKAKRQPTVWVVEGLHWADPSTLEFLGILMKSLGSVPLFLLLTYREYFRPPWDPGAEVTQLCLDRLTDPQAEALIEGVAGGALPAGLKRQIVAKTDGVPLFIEELTKSVVESDRVRPVAGGYELTAPLSALPIPATLRDSLASRLDRLERAKEVAQLAATVGREFSQQLLLAVSQLDEATVKGELERLVQAELIHRKGYLSEASYIFKHALIRDAAYESLLKKEREELHGRIAAALEGQFPHIADRQPELMAHHYTEAGQIETAVRFWQRAGEQAFQRSAIAETTAHLNRGLELIRRLPPGSERDRRELPLQAALGAALSTTQGFTASPVDGAYRRALELCQRQEDAPELFWVLWALRRFHYVRANVEEALELGQRLLRLVHVDEEPVRAMAAHLAVGAAHFSLGEFQACHDSLEQGIALDRPDRKRHYASHTGQDPGVACLSWAGLCLWFLGYPDQARRRSEAAIALARQVSDPISLTFALAFSTILSSYSRSRESVANEAREMIALSRDQGSWWDRPVRVFETWALALADPPPDAGNDPAPGPVHPQVAEVHPQVAEVYHRFEGLNATGTRLFQTQFLVMLAEVSAAYGRWDEARDSLDEALTARRNTGESFYEAEIHRLQGELAAPDDPGQAEGSFESALDLSRRQGARSLELRAATSLARLWRQQGRQDQARELLAAVYDGFTEGFESRDLEAARRLIEEL